MVKIWRVAFGNNWTSLQIKAKNIEQAIEIAKKKVERPIPKTENWIRDVTLMADSDY